MVSAIGNDARMKFDIYQVNTAISFRFLGINFGGGTSYYDLCRDMRTSANKTLD